MSATAKGPRRSAGELLEAAGYGVFESELLGVVEGALELVEPGNDRVSLVDVTPVNRTRNFHNFSLEVPEYFDDIFLRLTNAATPENRQRYQFRTPEGKTYWVLTRGR